MLPGMSGEDDDVVLTIGEAARLLRISLATAKKLAAQDELPGLLGKLGGQWRVSRRGLMAWVNQQGHSR